MNIMYKKNLKVILDSIEGLKEQSKIVLESNGNNKLINKEHLFNIQQKIHGPALNDYILKKHMKENKIASYIDINNLDFIEYYKKEINLISF